MNRLFVITRAVGCPMRQYVYSLLGERGLCVSEVAAQARLAPSSVCYHLGVLTAAGLTVRVPRGRKTLYRWSHKRWEFICRTVPAAVAVHP